MRLTIPCSILVSAAGLAAQCPESAGHLAGIPTALSVAHDAAVPFGGGDLLLKGSGFFSVPPGGYPNNGGPVFDFAALAKACGAQRTPDLDAMSLGLDWILADDSNGRVKVPPNRWAVLTLSVTRKSQGKVGSRIRTEATRPDGAAADVFSYVLPGSQLPKELVGITERAQDSREIDLGGGTQREVDALDHMIPWFTLDSVFRSRLSPTPSWFFSVSAASLADVPTSWWGSTPPSGATIFVSTWQTRSRSWTCPRVWRNFKEIGLGEKEDIDALAIDLGNQRMLFSTVSAKPNPIMFQYFGADFAPALPYTDPEGKPISDVIGLNEFDDADAICAMDPSIRSTSNGGFNPTHYAIATPTPRALPFVPAVTGSTFREFSGGQVKLVTHVVGWPSTGPGPGAGVLFLTPPGVLVPLVQWAVLPRNPASPWCGDPLRVELPIPPVLNLTGAQLDLRWFVADSALTALSEAWPSQVRL